MPTLVAMFSDGNRERVVSGRSSWGNLELATWARMYGKPYDANMFNEREAFYLESI